MTEAFKARIGLLGDENINAVAELELVLEEETEETLARFKVSKYAKNNFQKGQTAEFTKTPLKEPLLLKKHELDRLVSGRKPYKYWTNRDSNFTREQTSQSNVAYIHCNVIHGRWRLCVILPRVPLVCENQI